MARINKENIIKLLLIFMIFCMSIYAGKVSGQNSKNDLPQVFFIGEYQKEYDELINDHSDVLLTACNNSMEIAYEHWVDLMNKMEVYLEKNHLDIKGVKIWANVFWTKEGKIRHFAFYPKPNSKNIDYDKMKELVKSFLTQYSRNFPVRTAGYSHYGTGTFPVYAKLAEDK